MYLSYVRYILSLSVFSFLKFNMARNSRTLEFIALVRGFHVFRKKWKPALNEQLHCLQEPANDFHPSWHSDVVTTLWQRRWRCHNVVARSKMSCTDVSFRRCDNVALQRCQDVASTLLQRHHNIKITRPFYYGLLWFLSLHRNEKVTKVLSGIKHASFLFKKRYIYS